MSPRFEAVMVLAAMAAAVAAAARGGQSIEEVIDLGPDGAPRTVSTLRFKLPVKTVTITRTVGVPVPVPFPVRHDVPVPVHVHKLVFVPVPHVVPLPYSARPKVVAESATSPLLHHAAAASPAKIFALPIFQGQQPSLGFKDMGAFGIIVPGLAGQYDAAPRPPPPEDAAAATNGHQSGSAAPAAVYGYGAYRPARSPDSTVVTVSKSIELDGA